MDDMDCMEYRKYLKFSFFKLDDRRIGDIIKPKKYITHKDGEDHGSYIDDLGRN